MLKDFKFHSPAPVYFGHETVKNNAELIASYGKRCYITTTRFPAGCENEALKDFISVCEAKGIEYRVNEDVVENPTVESCVAMTQEAREFGADFFAGIGGGSSMDTAKCVSVLLTQPEDVDAYDFLFKTPVMQLIPGVVHMTASRSSAYPPPPAPAARSQASTFSPVTTPTPRTRP